MEYNESKAEKQWLNWKEKEKKLIKLGMDEETV